MGKLPCFHLVITGAEVVVILLVLNRVGTKAGTTVVKVHGMMSGLARTGKTLLVVSLLLLDTTHLASIAVSLGTDLLLLDLVKQAGLVRASQHDFLLLSGQATYHTIRGTAILSEGSGVAAT